VSSGIQTDGQQPTGLLNKSNDEFPVELFNAFLNEIWGPLLKDIYFGIDGGGTHSRLAIMNGEGAFLARSEAGSTNIYSVSREQVRENLALLLENALSLCGLEKADLAAGCLGSAGLGRPEEQNVYRAFFQNLLGPDVPVKLCTDGEILLVGGLGGLEGYCLIAGTGSVALGRSRDGRLVRAGGHGYLLGDEGSAAWIGRTAISRLLRSFEDRDLPSSMLPSLLSAAGLSAASELVRYVHHDADKAVIAALAPVVTAAARQGDPLALDILRDGAAELVLLVRSVIARSPWIGPAELVLAGGVIKHDEILTGRLRETLKKEFGGLGLREPERSAVDGACILARQFLLDT
jgi:N-acetylglucosamine kinase-like BadF-type ATPase